MKSLLLICLVLTTASLSACGLCRKAARNGSSKTQLTLSYWDVRGGEKGGETYDTKMIVFIDGDLAAESEPAPRYEKKNLSIQVKPGRHVLLIEGYALKNGKWEERTKEAGYSADHRLENRIDLKKGETRVINLVVPDSAQYLKLNL